jgi:hypothetical protein
MLKLLIIRSSISVFFFFFESCLANYSISSLFVMLNLYQERFRKYHVSQGIVALHFRTKYIVVHHSPARQNGRCS